MVLPPSTFESRLKRCKVKVSSYCRHFAREASTIRRILHFSRFCYLDTSSGAAIASRSVLECLARHHFEVEALCGTIVDSGLERDPADILAELGHASSIGSRTRLGATPSNGRRIEPPLLRTTFGGVPLTIHGGTTRRFAEADLDEVPELSMLFESTLDRFRPDVMTTYGGDPLTLHLIKRARLKGAAVAFALHNFSYTHPRLFLLTDAATVPSRFAADYYRASLGFDCAVLPNIVSPDHVRADPWEP